MSFAKVKEKFSAIVIPGWLFTSLMVLYNELMLHLWITSSIRPWRLVAVVLMALGCGCVMALITTVIPSEKGQKWTAVGVSGMVSVIWLTMYFVSDAYQVFMTPNTIVGGAGGVAEDYMDLIVSLVLRNLWRIGLMLLPVVLYGLFCRCERVTWKNRGVLAAAALAFYLLGMGISKDKAGDAARFGAAYDFDSAVRSLGLHMALTLEGTQGSQPDAPPAFVAAPAETTQATEPGVTPPEMPTEEPEVVYGDHVIEGLDYAALAEENWNPTIKGICQYLDSLTPAKENGYTGLFKGKNLILITAEAFTAQVIDPELTPTLYRMANEGIRFTEYYQPAWGASTTAGEFTNLVGLVPTNGGACMKEVLQQNFFLTMGHQLQAQGYTAIAYHNHNKDFYDRNKTHVHLGYDQFLAQYGGLEGITAAWPESDLEMIDVSVPQYIDKQPFSIYYMTVSGHSVYSRDANVMAVKHYDKVKDLPYAETVKCYLAGQLELEAAMASLIAQLEKAGIANDTVIVLATDHYPYGLEKSGTWKNTADYLSQWYGVKECDKFIRDRNALIIWSGCIEDMDLQVEEPVFSLDILPTLSNLFGVEYDSRLLVGRDVFSEEEPLVFWPEHSWRTDKGTYDLETGVFTPREGVTVEDGYVERISAKVSNKITYSRSVIDSDFFNVISP